MTILSKLKSKFNQLNRKVDDYQEAITFSEAGITNSTTREESRICPERTTRNLVVASLESGFTDEMVDYALEMAKRMDYGIIAVNAANLTHDVTEFFSSNHDDLFNEFKTVSEKNIKEFRNKAEELGLEFSHSVQFSTIENSIKTITKECGEIEFVISENKEKSRLRGVPENRERIAQRLCVYSMD